MTEPVPVTVAAPRTPMLLIAGLGALVLLFGVMLLVVLRNGTHRDSQIGQLACQVQRLGGKPVGDASCPPSPKPKVSPRAVVTPSPVPSRVVVTVRPRTAPQPAPGASPRRTTAPPSRPSQRPPPSHAPSPSPSPSCVRVPPVPLSLCR